jgi:TonB family protein
MKTRIIVALAWLIGVAPQAARAQDSGQTSSAPNAATQATPSQAESAPSNGACGDGMPGQLLHSVNPTYPQDAVAAGVEGSVSLRAVIGTDGTVQKIEDVSGPQGLQSAAVAAAKQWTFEPCSIDGKPTEVETTISFAFSLQGPTVRIQYWGKLVGSHLINYAAPKYPIEAKKAHIEGTVLLHGIIGKDGVLKNVEFVSGPSQLAEAAMNAVKQWKYRPATINGEPVEVHAQITVNFALR